MGSVLDGQTRAPVEGAMVVLVADGVARARVLTGPEGSYRLLAPEPGRYLLRVDRIGYASTLGEAFDVSAGSVVRRDVLTEVRPVTLAGIEVEGVRRCEAGPAEGLATGRVWEEARKALDAAAWTAEKGLYRFAWLRYERELAADGRRVLNEKRSYQRHFTPQPFRSLDGELLARDGYVREEDEVTVYYAPDAIVLLSDAFLDTHCFGLERKEEDGRRLVGLRFEPVPGRDLPDVEGVLWLEEEGARLRSVAYRYVDRRSRPAPEPGGGELTFRGLPNGTWIVQEWRIRMPELREVRDLYGAPRRFEVLGYRDEGGLVSRIFLADGTLLQADEELAALAGQVTDSAGRPAAGAEVWIEGTALAVTADDGGAFRFGGMLPGTWTVRASHPSLRAAGHAGSAAEVEVEARGAARVELALPSVKGLVSLRCPGAAPGEAAVLLGRVLDERGSPVGGAEVRVLWTTVRSTPTAVRTRLVRGRPQRTVDVQTRSTEEGWGTTSDGEGVFALCAVPAGAELRASAHAGGRTSPLADLIVAPDAEVVTTDLVLADSPAEPAQPSEGPSATRSDELPAGTPEGQWLAARGFTLREEGALLHWTGEELRALGIDSLTQLLRRVPEVVVRVPGVGHPVFLLHPDEEAARAGTEAGACELEIRLNGSRLLRRADRSDEASWDETLNRRVQEETGSRAPALRIASGVELFRSGDAPVAVEGGCGVLLLWIHRLRAGADPGFAGDVRGRVLEGADARPSAGVPVTLIPGGRRAVTDAGGRFAFEALPPARYRVLVEVPGWGPWSTDVLVRADGVSEVVLEVEGGGR